MTLNGRQCVVTQWDPPRLLIQWVTNRLHQWAFLRYTRVRKVETFRLGVASVTIFFFFINNILLTLPCGYEILKSCHKKELNKKVFRFQLFLTLDK